MQLYQVSFQVHYVDMIDMGNCLIVAASQEDAAERIGFYLDLPGSMTVYDVTRIKPNFYQLDRREIIKHLISRSHNARLAPKERYIVSVIAGIRAASEYHAWRKLAHAILDRCGSNKARIDRDITELEVTCERTDSRPVKPQIDKQAIYKETRIFQGGRTSPR